jgi:hypothetical protein
MPKVLNYNIFRLFRRNSKIGVMVLEIGCQLSVGRYAYTQYKLVPVWHNNFWTTAPILTEIGSIDNKSSLDHVSAMK